MFEHQSQTFFDYYKRLFPYVESKYVTTNDVDKSLDSLWNRFCTLVTDEDRRQKYCLVTFKSIKVLSIDKVLMVPARFRPFRRAQRV